MSDPIEQFRQAIAAAGLEAPHTIEPGKWIKFPGYQKSVKNRAAWCYLFDDLRGGVFGDYSSGMQSNWSAINGHTPTQAERDAHRTRIKAMQALREAEQVQRHQSAAVQAATRWQAAINCTRHAYLDTKGVQSHAIKQDGESLLIPMRDTAGTLHSLQAIAPDGHKRFHPGGQVKDCYHAIGKPAGALIVCEGYATGASIHEATGQAVAVAFNAGNLEPVALALRAKYPALKIIMAADDDIHTAGNPGLTKATAAALAVGGLLAVPEFPAGRGDKDNDFNDLHKLAGLDVVRRCIEAAKCVFR